MMEAGTAHTGGCRPTLKPPVCRRWLGAPGRWRSRAVLAAFLAVVPLTTVVEDAGASGGCTTAPHGAARTIDGLPPESGEASGFAASRQYPGAVWMIRDSGHPNDLYALRFNADGRATSRVLPVAGADNRDWEEVTRFERPDGSSALWIVESGQSGSNRTIYELTEPDPDKDVVARATAKYTYAYPDAKSNTEAAFTYDNKLVLVSKSFPARVYRFDKPLSTSGTNVPTLIGELSDSRGVSVAKPSPDRKWLATATHDTLFLYKNRGSGSLEDFLDREPFHAMVFAPEDNVEAGDFAPAFGDCLMLFASERRNTYRVASGPAPPSASPSPAP
jgi:WD40 repeat protein